MRQMFLVMMSVAVLASTAGAAVIANHTGNTNPTSEGFALNAGSGSPTSGPLTGDGPGTPTDAWYVEDPTGSSWRSYQQNLTGAECDDLADNGLSLLVKLRVPDTYAYVVPGKYGVTAAIRIDPVTTAADRQVWLQFGADSSKNPIVELRDDNGNVVYTQTLSDPTGDYHTYEFIGGKYNVGTGSYETDSLKIDGSTVWTGNLAFSHPLTQNWIQFGDLWNGGGEESRGNWAEVTLTALPEPATMALLVVGALPLLRRRRA